MTFSYYGMLEIVYAITINMTTTTTRTTTTTTTTTRCTTITYFYLIGHFSGVTPCQLIYIITNYEILAAQTKIEYLCQLLLLMILKLNFSGIIPVSAGSPLPKSNFGELE